ncbi:MAG: UDP-3-O-(3-hydroxymyristoyl)glucosamine N-acyltransferase [Crocinitomicaceae bacterium]
MILEQSLTLKELASFLNCEFIGNENLVVSGVNEMHNPKPGDVVYVDNAKSLEKAIHSPANVILYDKPINTAHHKGVLLSKNAFSDFNKIIAHFFPDSSWSIKSEENEIDASARIAPNVSIGNNVKIAADVIIHPGAVIGDNTVIKEGVIIGPNSVIGYDAFYYKKSEGKYSRLLSCGGTVIEKDVEIGALTTIDRGVTGWTIIGEGTKIDNQVHVGHDTVIGKHCLLAANVGISGCVVIEDNVTLWGQVGVISDIKIGKGSVVQGQSGVSRSLDAEGTYFGSPASEVRKVLREMAAVRKLPSILESL